MTVSSAHVTPVYSLTLFGWSFRRLLGFAPRVPPTITSYIIVYASGTLALHREHPTAVKHFICITYLLHQIKRPRLLYFITHLLKQKSTTH